MKMNKQNKAFTLVELMIVIAIIGVLAATLLPRLQGAQERSRDTGRVSSVNQIAAVLQTYFSDRSTFPSAPASTTNIDDASGGGCLSDANGVVNSALAPLLKGGIAPLDPQRSNTSNPCATPGSYGYHAIASASQISLGGYAIIANVEAYQKANYDIVEAEHPVITHDAEYSTIELMPTNMTVESTSGGASSLFVEKS